MPAAYCGEVGLSRLMVQFLAMVYVALQARLIKLVQ